MHEGRSGARGGRANGGSPPLSGPKDHTDYSQKYRAGWSNPGTPPANPGTPPAHNRGISDHPGLIQCSIARYLEFSDRQPFIRWGTLPDSYNENYEEYGAGNQHIRDRVASAHQSPGCLFGGQYFAPVHHDWDPDRHRGGKKGGSAPKVIRPKRVFIPESDATMRTPSHLVLTRPPAICS